MTKPAKPPNPMAPARWTDVASSRRKPSVAKRSAPELQVYYIFKNTIPNLGSGEISYHIHSCRLVPSYPQQMTTLQLHVVQHSFSLFHPVVCLAVSQLHFKKFQLVHSNLLYWNGKAALVSLSSIFLHSCLIHCDQFLFGMIDII